MRFVNPTFGVSEAGGEKVTGQSFDWMKDPIALFSNSKPNARELMDGLKTKLADVNEKIARLAAIRSALQDLICACPGRGPAARCCSILEALETAEIERAPAD